MRSIKELFMVKIRDNRFFGRITESVQGRAPDWTNPVKVALLAILLFSFLIYNYTNFRNVSWTIHPDSHEAYVIGKHLKETGNLTFDVPAYDVLEENYCAPSGSIALDGKVLPQRAYGFYFICALGLFLGENGPFYLIPLFGLIAILFFFKSAEIIMDEKKALLATFLFAVSAPMIYWSTMLFANVPGFTFVIIGFYFLLKIVYKKDDSLKSYIISAVFFSAGVWLRYEYVIIIILMLPLLFLSRKNLKPRYLLIGLIVVLLCLSPILLANKAVYGNAFSTGYTLEAPAEEADLGSAGGESQESMFSKLFNGVKRIFNRFLTQIIHPRFNTIYEGFTDSVNSIFPVLTLAAFFGLLLMFSYGGVDRAVGLTLLLIVLFFVFNSFTGFLWDAGIHSSILGTSYVRYNLFIYLVFALLSALFISRTGDIFGKRGYRTILVFVVISFFLIQSVFLFSGPFALRFTAGQEGLFKEISQAADELPENAVLVGALYPKAVMNRPVLNTYGISAGEEPVKETAYYIRTLLDHGYEVYLMESSWHKATYLNLERHIGSMEGISVRPLRNFQWVEDDDIIRDTMFQVFLD